MRSILALLLFASVCPAQPQATIPLKVLKDKIAGGWAGQMIGVSYGAPTEFRYKEQIIPLDKLPKWSPDKISNSINQDDLYVDMTFAQVLDDKGLNATTEDFGAMFKDAKYALWHANLAARRALKRGVPARLSGTPKYNSHANDIDFQIEADFVGLMAPGMLRPAVDIAMRAGRVMNYGDGIYGGVFVSCMYSAAFFEKDPRKLVEAGLSCIPAKSPYAMLIADVLAWHKQYPNDWEANWREIEKKWNKREPCPAGALDPFNIDAKINGAYIALGLLYGGGDMEKTIVISTRAGQDSDCNPSSAAGVLGVAMGYDAIPDIWKSGIPAIADKKFSYTEYTFRTIVESSLQRSIKLAEANGGRLDGDTLHVVMAAPKPPKLEIWDDYGSPVERVPVSDARWKFAGGWQDQKTAKVSDVKGATAEISFEGTGFIVVGPYLAAGGFAEVWIDGKKANTVDVYPDEPRDKGQESVCHAFKMKRGKHTVKLVVTGVKHADSTGAKIAVQDLVVFR
ncbi:MAG: hypothetical protein C0504_03320 [Candidatus Solibacter sp.]|nr:hypothetical protein [Candidatus Solibacter sp.]